MNITNLELLKFTSKISNFTVDFDNLSKIEIREKEQNLDEITLIFNFKATEEGVYSKGDMFTPPHFAPMRKISDIEVFLYDTETGLEIELSPLQLDVLKTKIKNSFY